MTQTSAKTSTTGPSDKNLVHRAAATADGKTVRTDDSAVEAPLAMAGDSDVAQGSVSPEHLMAAALAGCLQQALRVAASSLGQDAAPSVEAVVTLTTGEGVGYTAAFDLTVSGLDGEHADDLLTQATALCPFTTALDGRGLTVSRA